MSLFPEYEKETDLNNKIDKSNEIWAHKKCRNFGMEYCSNAFFQGKYGIPLIKKYTGSIPSKLITLDEVNNIGSRTTGIVTFSYDYILDDIADHPERFLNKFQNYAFIAEPDFSMKVMDPLSVIIANTFRSHSTALYFQENGCQVMPVMKWSTSASFEVCFDGYEKGGVVMVSTIGVLRDERSHFYFKSGLSEMFRRISPESVILYGDVNEWIMDLFPSQLDIHHFSHERFNRMRNGR